jgi:hypothetical protein
VKRVCRAVNPASKGLCVDASTGNRISRVKRVMLGHNPAQAAQGTARTRRPSMGLAIIGTSDGPCRTAICRERKPDPRSASNKFLEVGYDFWIVITAHFLECAARGREIANAARLSSTEGRAYPVVERCLGDIAWVDSFDPTVARE